MPDIVKKPVDQNPKSTTSPRPKEGKIPNITAKRYIKSIPITNVGSETPKRETAHIMSLKKLLRFIPVYTPKRVPEISAINAETITNSKVAGNLSEINSETGLLN